MNPLQYTSEEMFSSTELIRKSKMVFDKLHNNEIEKAIILRDGKPSFMLLDFSEYEKIMKEYLSLKEKLVSKDTSVSKIKKEIKPHVIKKVEEKPIEKTMTSAKEIDELDLENALAEIDNLNLDELDLEIENIEKQIDEKEPLKEFWE